MRRLALIALVAFAAAALGYKAVGLRHATEERTLATVPGSDPAWLRVEFGLDDTQYARVRALHDAYVPVCSRHCAAILVNRERLDALQRDGAPAGTIAAAHTAIAALEETCNAATLAHVRQVAAVMAPEQGRRYLAMVGPHLARWRHEATAAAHD